MKKMIPIVLCLVLAILLAGCGSAKTNKEESSQTTKIGNPWSSWSSIAEAEETVGFSFGLPEVIDDIYVAQEVRTLSSELIEVIYHEGDSEFRIRKQKGEDQDISGDYNNYEFCSEQTQNGSIVTSCHNSNDNAVKQLVSYEGYSWSFVSADGWWGEANQDFLQYVVK